MDSKSFNTKFSFDMRNVPFRVESKFIVITGGPYSGKTALLSSFGIKFQPEYARIFIEERLAAGESKYQIRSDEGKFQRELFNAKQQIENSLDRNIAQFFDRGLPDSITYYRAAGLDPSEILEACKQVKYTAVFLLDLLPEAHIEQLLLADPVRTEDGKIRTLIDTYLEIDYISLGYQVIRVPFLSIDSRKEFIFAELGKLGITRDSFVG